MNDREKRERLAAAPPNPTQRLVLAAVLMHLTDGWCTATRAELAAVTGVHPATITRAINALIPAHLERVVQRPQPTALKPAQRRIAVRRSIGAGGRRSTAHLDDPLPRAGADLRAGAKNSNGPNRIRSAAELDRLLRGTNVHDFRPSNKTNPAPPDPSLKRSTPRGRP